MIISKENAQHYQWGACCDGWHLLKNDALHIIHEKMPPHTRETRHYHEKSQQFFFLLSGAAEIEIDGERFHLLPMQGVEVLPGQPHCMMNNSEEDTEFLVVSSPSSHGDKIPCMP